MRTALRDWWNAERGPKDFGDYFARFMITALIVAIAFGAFLAVGGMNRPPAQRPILDICVGNWDCDAGTYKYGEAGEWLTNA